ncbi:hypothetical protein [Erysipelothrix piscisicarius]
MAFIFDLDGTLLDSIDDLGNNLNTVLQRLMGFPHMIAPNTKNLLEMG